MTMKRCSLDSGRLGRFRASITPASTLLCPGTIVAAVSLARNQQVNCASSQAAVKEAEEHNYSSLQDAEKTTAPIGESARQKQANREFFTSLLSSAATKRDAKAYISRLKNPSKIERTHTAEKPARPQVNLGNLFGTARAVDQSPVFSQYELEQRGFESHETLHVALVKLNNLKFISDHVVDGLAETLVQLSRLGMAPCVVLESSVLGNSRNDERRDLKGQADRLAQAIDVIASGVARVVDNVLTTSSTGDVWVTMKKLLLVPLRRGSIPILVPHAFSTDQQRIVSVPANDAIVALTKEFTGLRDQTKSSEEQNPDFQTSLDRIIVIDETGGIPSPVSSDGKQVFLNLEQEYSPVTQYLADLKTDVSIQHLSNVHMLRNVLKILPASASGIIATPEEAANLKQIEQDFEPSTVGTRRQKNALIHNLLTDKPAYSSSLPKSRLSKQSGSESPVSATTFVKHGMPLKILPNPAVQPWTPDSPRIKLTDSQIDLTKLVHLIDDSFNRKLDIEHYLQRVNERIAGVIIAGDYEGGAILTWEPPPGVSATDTSRLVPYLDKFAVLKRSQGAGGVADIVFNAMVRTCFPSGVCWRSRKNNPVNKWYFERSRGTKKIPDMNWTMFWTTPGVASNEQKFGDYEGVCRGVEPSWLDKKMAAD